MPSKITLSYSFKNGYNSVTWGYNAKTNISLTSLVKCLPRVPLTRLYRRHVTQCCLISSSFYQLQNGCLQWPAPFLQYNASNATSPLWQGEKKSKNRHVWLWKILLYIFSKLLLKYCFLLVPSEMKCKNCFWKEFWNTLQHNKKKSDSYWKEISLYRALLSFILKPWKWMGVDFSYT